MNTAIKAAHSQPKSLRSFLSQLHLAMRHSESEVPLSNGSFTTIKDHGGLNYYLVAKERVGSNGAAWFSKLRAAESFNAVREPDARLFWPKEAVFYLVHWPQLLSTALSTRTNLVTTPMAYELVHQLVDVWDQHDRSFAAEVRRRRNSNVSVTLHNHALYPNEQDGMAIRFWDDHLTALLKSKRALKDVRNTMRHSLRIISHAAEEQRITACPTRRHREATYCETCEPIKWMRQTSVLLPNLLSQVAIRERISVSPVTSDDFLAGLKDPWLKEVKHLLDCRTAHDGAVPIMIEGNEVVMVNWQRVAEVAEVLRPDAAALKLRDPYSPRDHLFTGIETRRAFDAKYRANFDRTIDSESLITAHGWQYIASIDTPYAFYSRAALLDRVRRASVSLSRLVNVNRRGKKKERAPFQKKPVKVAVAPYTLSNGQQVDIRIVRRRQWDHATKTKTIQNHYEVPYALDKSMLTVESRRIWTSKVFGQWFWTPAGIEYHATRIIKAYDKDLQYVGALEDANQAPLNDYPEAAAFAAWARQMDTQLDKEGFRRLRYSNSHQDRVDRVLTGEIQHLAMFSFAEDAIITATVTEPRKTKNLSVEQWNRLLAKLPGRNRQAVQRRIKVLGYEYALKHGYKAYSVSGFMLNYSAKRFHEFRKKGVRE